ncbi:hypothetical protein ACFYVL_17160 [Streptomyces sp. NPDC004111]|uniref:hypothetical protein n=1 Tax=Streptomyces sp. NPDC004111 TaxID=3364690 RepID=UPI0036AC3DA5
MVTKDPVCIGITGTHSTGKTELLRRIEMELRGHGIIVGRTGGLGKHAAALGFPKMQHHTARSTEWIIARGIADELALGASGAQVVLADRAPVDALAYFTAALEFRGDAPGPWEVEQLTAMASVRTDGYALLFATVLDPTVPVAASHDYNPRFRTLVDRHCHTILATGEVKHVRVTSAAESKNEAIRMAVDAVLGVVV